MELDLVYAPSCVKGLRCSLCQRYLSYFPIRTSSKANICGRCRAPDDTSLFLNTAFETVSQHMKFPCCYQEQGCEGEYYPSEIPEHEKSCLFRGLPCPLVNSGCMWKGPNNLVLGHCQNEHSGDFLQNGEFNGETVEKYSLVEYGGLLLIFKRRFDADKTRLLFELYTGEGETNPRQFSCKITTTCEGKSFEKQFKNSTFNDTPIPEELELEGVSCENVQFKLTVGDGVNMDGLKTEMLALLKCFICQNYALPPIYHCDDHSETLCDECKTSHSTTCSRCRENPSRNINLDKMAEFLEYPCKNRDFGCPTTGKPEEMKKHNPICTFVHFICPLKSTCNYKGSYRNLVTHIENEHQELLSNNTVMTKQLRLGQMKFDVVKYSNKLFRLATLLTNQNSQQKKYMWSVQMLGPYKEGFYYEIQITDPQKEKKMCVRRLCGKLTSDGELFSSTDNYCYFSEDQIREFIADEKVVFKLRIFV